jgi:hypothetical protein
MGSMIDTAYTSIGAPAQANEAAADPGLLARKLGWLRDLPARSALRACNHPLVRGLLGRRHASALADHQTRLPLLSASDRHVVEAVERDGVFMTTLDALGLPASDEVMLAGRSLATAFAAQARARAAAGEVFLYVPPERLLVHPGVFSWGLHDRLLDIAEAYIGLRPAYDGVCLNYTVADGREISTRKWHRDWEDRRMLKVCIYLHDVDDGGGPFEIIRRPDTMQNDADGFVYSLADDVSLQRWLGDDLERYKLSCEGPAGTVIFMDTARFFHRGKPATTSDRAALFYSYFAHRPRHPFLCERSGMTRRDIARLAGTLPDRQRAAAQWRQLLPLFLRAIPPARL